MEHPTRRFTFALLCASIAGCAAPSARPLPEPEALSAEAVVVELYDHVSVDPGHSVDWQRVRELFDQEAVFVLRTSREGTTQLDLEGWIDDFVTFIARSKVDERGFFERILRTETTSFGDIAHVLVLYEAGFPDEQRAPRPGVDSIQLARREGVWRIVSVLNEVPAEGRPLPASLRD